MEVVLLASDGGGGSSVENFMSDLLAWENKSRGNTNKGMFT